MHMLTLIIALIVLFPAALAGIAGGLLDAMANFERLSAALPHASAMLAEMAPIAPAALMLLAGVATLGLVAWLMVRTTNGE